MEGSSSPDPLNDLPTYPSTVKPRRTPGSRILKTLPRQSSPKKQTFQLELGNELSSQKIKVTVEADSDNENLYNSQHIPSSPSRAPTNRRGERTFTTTVPVKGLSDSEANNSIHYAATPRKLRGRPKKSGTPVPAKTLASTPMSRSAKRKTFGELVDGDDDQDVDFRLSQGLEVGKGRGRSRSPTKSSKKSKTPSKDNAPTPKKRGRPRKSLPVQDSTLTEMQLGGYEGDFTAGISNNKMPSSASPAIGSTTTTEKEDVIPDVVLARFHPGNETPKQTGWSSPQVVDTDMASGSRHRAHSYPSPTESPAKTDSDVEYEDDNDDHEEVQDMEDLEEEEEEDEAGELRDYDTIMESEEFSMISVDSVNSLREHLKTPAEQLQKTAIVNNHLLSVQKQSVKDNDSFSSIPADILEAASPVRRSPNTALKATRYTTVDESFFSVSVETSKTPARPQPRPSEANQEYDVPFPAVSPTLLDKSAVCKVYPSHEKSSIPGGPNFSLSGDVSPRLLTPEETPSPHEHNIKDSSSYRKPSPSILSEAAVEKSVELPAQIGSSPPAAAPQRYTNPAHFRNQRHLDIDTTQTPSIIFSSPTLPPQHVKEQHNFHMEYEPSDRPTLSPVARTGRVLQDIAVPSSPRSRSQSLGSPFKSPLTDRRSSSVALPPEPISMQDRLTESHLRLTLGSQFMESSQRLRRLSSGQEDAYENDAEEKEKSPSPEQYRLGVPHSRQQSESRALSRKPGVDTLRNEDSMSWQADKLSISYKRPKTTGTLPAVSNPRRYPLERDNVPVEDIALTSEQRWEAEREEVRKQISSADPSKVVTIESDDDEEMDNGQVEDEEDFGLLLDTLNSISPQKQPVKEVVERPARGKLPSPWKQKSKQLVHSGEISQMSSPQSPKSKHKKRDGSSAVFQNGHRVETRGPNNDLEIDLSTWQIPQKSNFKPRARETGNLDLSALLSASPAKNLPVLAKSSQPSFFVNKVRLSSSVSSIGSREQTKRASVSSEASQSKSLGFQPIPQKMGFNPRPTSPVKKPSAQPSLLNRTFQQQKEAPPEPASSSALASKSVISKSSSPAIETPESIRSSQISLDEKEKEKENQDFQHRTLDWAKSMHSAAVASTSVVTPVLHPPSSPTKSCFRAASKTPTAQSDTSYTPRLSPSKAVAFVSSSPMSSPSSAPLSSTEWSVAHWQLLDAILQDWKVEIALSKPNTDAGTSRRRNSTRVISRLLGKTVRSQGESMVLEQWHLEAVDEFRREVPGWEEKIIAMRLFSLILTAERRARGVGSSVESN